MRALVAVLLFVGLAGADEPAPPTTVTFEGVVLDRTTRKPLAGMQIALPELGLSATTDASGHFAIAEVPLGAHRVTVGGPGVDPVATDETFAVGFKPVAYLIQKAGGAGPYRTTVRARLHKEAVETTVRVEEARRIPGAQGDPLKVVQNLPGVARAAFGSGQLIVWGAAPRDTRVYVDGMEIPALYHVGGVRSTVNGDLVSAVQLVPGAYGGEYGRGLGGLVRVDTRALPDEGVHGYVAADLLDASALLTIAAGKRLKIAIAGRYGWLDRILSGLISPEVGDYFPIPSYDDYQLKATLALHPGETLTLLFLAADDRLRRSLPSNDPAQARSDTTNTSTYRAMLRYSRLADDGARIEVAPFAGFDHNAVASSFGAVPATQTIDAWRYGLRAGYRKRVMSRLSLAVGLDLQGTRARVRRSGSLTLPPREGDLYVFGQPPGDDVASDDFTAHILDAAPYLAAELTLGPLTITPSLRADAVLLEGNHLERDTFLAPPVGFSRLTWGLDPRLALAWRVHPRVLLTAAAGLYHQAPEPEELSAVFGNPTLGLQSAVHVTGGLAVQITDTLRAEAVGFYKKLDSLISRSPLPSPELARALVQDGSGSGYGAQLIVRQELWKGLFGWVSYTVSRSERQDHPGAAVRLFDYDQTHVLTALASYEFRGWAFGARFRLSSGFPRTPVIGSFFDARGDQYQPVFGRQNSIRIPEFYQLDLRVEKTFTWPKLALHVYVDVQNVTYQRNPEEIVYSEDFSRRGYITGLPTLAVLGVRVQF
jgi:hypothetical protein